MPDIGVTLSCGWPIVVYADPFRPDVFSRGIVGAATHAYAAHPKPGRLAACPRAIPGGRSCRMRAPEHLFGADGNAGWKALALAQIRRLGYAQLGV